MIATELNNECGLFPSDIVEVSLRCIDDDVFCWVSAESQDRLIALSGSTQEAQSQLASTLVEELGFVAAKAALTAQTLFAHAFGGVELFREQSGSAVVEISHPERLSGAGPDLHRSQS